MSAALVTVVAALTAGLLITRDTPHHARTTPLPPADSTSAASAAPAVPSSRPTTTTTVTGDQIEVTHTRVEVRLTGDLTCQSPIGTEATVTVDTYSDRAGRRWRTTYTFPDGATDDVIATGSAIYPTTLAGHGTSRVMRLACPQAGQPDVTLVAVGDDSLYFLNMPAELTTDEQPYYPSYTTMATRTSSDAIDSRGRKTEMWTWQVNGFTDVDSTRPIAQTTRWWVDPPTGSVTEQTFTTTIVGLGTATRTDTLTDTETATVPADFFDATGYSPLTPTPRPSVPPARPPVDSAPTPATTPGSTDTAGTLPVTSTTSASPLGGAACAQWTSPRPGTPPGTFGVALPASILSCHPTNVAGTIARGTTALWVAQQRDDGTNIAVRLDTSLTPAATIDLADSPMAMAADGTALWVITSHGGGAPAHVVRIDIAHAAVTLDAPLDGTSIADGPVPPMAVSIAGNAVWVTVANGPNRILHYRTDGTPVGAVTLPAPPAAIAATDTHVYVLAGTGELDAVDTTTHVVTRLATLPPATRSRGTLAADATDVWADTDELVHVDVTTGQVTDRTPAIIEQLAIDPHTGRAWAARYEPDPNTYPGAGTGSVVRLADHGVTPDGALYFDTLMSNGISHLAFTDDGTLYGENGYTGELVRVELRPG